MSKLEKICQDAETLPLQLSPKRIAEIRPVNNTARCKGLGHHRLIADDPKLNVVSFRIESPVIKSQHAEHPHTAADTLHADSFALEIRRRLDVGSDHERAIEFVNQTCDEDQIESARHGADGGAGRRTAVELGFSGGERRQSHRPAAHVDDLSVQTMLLKNPRIFGDKKNPAPFVQPP